MCLIIGEVDGHIECDSIEYEKNGSKYLVFDSGDENEEVLKKYTELWDGIKNEIETINDSKKDEYDEDFMKIKFDADDNLPLNKPLKLRLLTIIVGCIFEEDGKFYSQLYFDHCLYGLRVASNIMLVYDRTDISEGIHVNKTSASKECDICCYWHFKNTGFKYEPYLCNGCHDLMQKVMSFNDVAVVYVKGSAYRIHFW